MKFLTCLLASLPLASLSAEQAKPAVEKPAVNAAAQPAVAFQKWTPELEAKLRKQGRFILINFTADWCLNTKVNEKRIFSDKGFLEAFKAKNVAFLEVDMTKQNEQHKAYLETYGGKAIPLMVLAKGNKTADVVLDEILKPKDLIDALNSFQPEKSKKQ